MRLGLVDRIVGQLGVRLVSPLAIGWCFSREISSTVVESSAWCAQLARSVMVLEEVFGLCGSFSGGHSFGPPGGRGAGAGAVLARCLPRP